MDHYYIGVDGGGSSTTIFLGDENGHIVAKEIAESTNYLAVGQKTAFDRLHQLLQQLCQNNSIILSNIQCAVFGFAGAGRQKDKTLLLNYLMNILPDTKIQVEHDATIALLAGHKQAYGGVLIAGTGSIALGIDHSSNIHRIGGNGHLIDDFGSGYDIGRRVLTSVLMSMDGRGNHTLMHQLLNKQGYNTAEDIISYVYRPDFTKKDIGQFAKIAFDANDLGDAIANKIIEHGIVSLANLGTALIKQCKDYNFPLIFHGGLFKHQPTYADEVLKAIQQVYPQVSRKKAHYDAGIGALIMAWKMDNIFYEEADHDLG